MISATEEARLAAWHIATAHGDVLRDDENLDGLLNDIAKAIEPGLKLRNAIEYRMHRCEDIPMLWNQLVGIYNEIFANAS